MTKRLDDRLFEATVLFAVVLAVYAANGRTIWSWDTQPARYIPFALARHGTFYLDAYVPLDTDDRAWKGGTRVVLGHRVSFFPVGAPLLAMPIFLPAILAGVEPNSRRARAVEKVAAATITSLSVVVLYLALLEVTSKTTALVLALAYAFGTPSFSTSSQALWQHGPSQLAIATTIWFLLLGRTRSPTWIALAGFTLSFAIVCRPSNVFLALPIGLYVLICWPRQVVWFVLCGLPPALFQMGYNTAYFGRPLFSQHPLAHSDYYWRPPNWNYLSGLLFSPGRGLFVYSPIFLFSFVGLAAAWRKGGDPLLRALFVSAVSIVVLYSKWRMWWGGTSYGPRLLADLSPVLIFGLYPLSDLAKHRFARTAFAVALAWSIGAHAIGAFGDDGRYSPSKLWSWSDNQLVNPVKRAWTRVTTPG